MTSNGKVLILGADGFIGRHIAFALRTAGWQVTAHARDARAMSCMGFDTIGIDLADPVCHVPEFWSDALADGAHVINAAGLLTGSQRAFEAVHVSAPKAVYAAMAPEARGVLISAIGIDADTSFGRWRRAGEDAATDRVTILRPGLVLGATSYGGSSLARALAAMPLVIPVVGDGSQRFNPIHATDLAAIVACALTTPPGVGPHTVGGPENISQAGLLQLLRQWMGQSPVPLLRLPLPLARCLGWVGDVMRLGPISRTAVAQLSHGVYAPPVLGPTPRGVSTFVMAQPAGSQDLWHARLYLFRPLLRFVLVLLWLASGVLGLTLPASDFLPLIHGTPVPENALIFMARLGGVVDLGIALALLRGWRLHLMGWVQLGMVAAYTVTFSVLAPALWLLPLGGLLKNLPILALIAVWMVLEREK